MNTARALDQFYTDPALARALTARLLAFLDARGLRHVGFLEPSAGEGAFVDALADLRPSAQRWACDLDPKHREAQRSDFFAFEQTAEVVFGNPPFGKNATLAVRFFNHAARSARVIAFIVPRTFEKDSLKNRLDDRFELADQTAIDPRSFRLNGENVAVPCVFQIWERLPVGKRRAAAHAATSHRDFRFVKDRSEAAFVFQRVGAQAGRTKEVDHPHAASASHYFLAPNGRLSAATLRKRLDSIDWDPIKGRTAGNPSIGKGELVAAYARAVAERAKPRPNA